MPAPSLLIRSGAQAGASYPVPDTLMIGRSTRADIVLADEAVSREHASVRADGVTLVIEDLDSANGTWVNGERIDAARRLEQGDVIHVGDTELTVIMETGEEQLATPSEPTVIRPAPGSGTTRS